MAEQREAPEPVKVNLTQRQAPKMSAEDDRGQQEQQPQQQHRAAPMAALRACRCLPSLSTSILSTWRKTNDGGDRAVREFFQVMLGYLGPDARSANEAADCSMSLEEVTAEAIRELVVKECRRGDSSGGLVRALRPYLEDLVTRRQGFRGMADLLAGAVDVEEADVPARLLAELTPKDLFLALLEATPRTRQVRLATAYASLRNPLPVIFRRVDRGGEVRTNSAFDMLHELACVPAAGRQLVVSIGTQRAIGCGKTMLLGALALTSAGEEELDSRPCGPMHTASCDLICADHGRWVADAHGHWAGTDGEFRTAMLALVCWGQAACLIHCTMGDFHAKTGAPNRELLELLGALCDESLPRAPSHDLPSTGGIGGAGATPPGSAGAIVLVRDATSELLAPKRASMEGVLRQHCSRVLGLFPVEDLRAFRSTTRRASALERLRASLEERLVKAWPRGPAVPSLEALRHIHSSLTERLRSAGRAVESPAPSPDGAAPAPSDGGIAWRSALGASFLALLDRAHQSGATFSTLFPLSAVFRRLTALRRAEGGSGAPPVGGNSQLERLRLEEDQERVRAAQIQKLEAELAAAECSAAMVFFLGALTAQRKTVTVAELRLYLEEWKEPRVLPLLERQRELLDRMSKEGSPAKLGVVASAPAAPPKADLELLHAQLAELDFSIDSFWAELELLSQRPGKVPILEQCSTHAQGCWQSLVRDGQPFQVLHGRPLCMAGKFLRSVLDAIGAPAVDSRGIFVVSVIGAQSSAKSTLLNFLFGAGFAVRAGRCTRGLYASFFKPTGGGQPVLVLDSEGLLSLGSEGAVFDGQIALMCMTCSHLVLVNHKGELSRQLQDLLEICLFAMKHLRITRLQPRLVFVLRDQHDRSNSVHEDMLKQMRKHLEETAISLGAPLEDLILLDGTAVFLLPSAVTSELRQGQEVCWTSELFAREVLRLRAEVFRWLHEDASRRAGGGPPEFSSLTHWFDYATTVWETLVQFGEQLLHYKTIHEIELRRELADVAKAAVQHLLDGSPADDGEQSAIGFHGKARQMVDSFATRVQAGHSKLDLDTTDMEFSRALACLRDECVSQLEELFLERAADPRFSATAKEQARQQIRTPIEWAFENHLYTWKLHLKRASDEQAMHALWIHFTGVLNRHLMSSGHRTTLSEAESKSLFESEWRDYEAHYLTRFKSLMKNWQTLAHEVTLLFNHAVAKLQHEAGTLALLKEVGPQQVVLPPDKRRAGGITPIITDQTDDEWEEQYFYVGWWASMKKRGLAFLQSGGAEASDDNALKGNLVPRMRQLVWQGLQQFRSQVVQRGALDEGAAADGLRHITGVVLQDIESRLLVDWSVTLKRPQMLHALNVALRLVCIEALVAVEEGKQEKAMKDLLEQKVHVEEHFLLIIQTNKGDVDRAANFAALYHRSLTSWLDHEVTRLAADVRNQVLQEMPDPQKSSERAFQMSFASRNWADVLEYVIDMNSYLEKLFLTLFHQRKRNYVTAARSRLEKRVLATYALLQATVNQWARREAGGTPADMPDVDVTKGPSSPSTQWSVRELKDFISTHAERVPADAEKADAHRQLAERLPATADFSINDPRLFAEAFQARIADFIEAQDIHERLVSELEKALQEQSIRAWSLIRGCSERCPLCGSKCDIVGEHSHHHCTHHLFPAFHGWMDRNTGLPSFNHCLGTAREGTYQCKDGTWRKLEDYLAADHPSWLPFKHDKKASESDVPYLRAAWVNCREPLLEYFSPMAEHCPEDWREDYEEGAGGRLTSSDLKVAKETIRRLREHTWTPPED